MRSIARNSTSQGVVLRILDATTGLPKTDVTHASSGLSLWYRAEGGSRVTITAASLDNVNSAYTSGGFIHIADGDYRLDLPDAALTTGAGVKIGGTVTGGVVYGPYVPIVDYNPLDAAGLGLSRIDAAITTRQATVSFPANFAALLINSDGHVSRVTLVDTTTTNSDMRGTDNALLAASYTAPPSEAAIYTYFTSDNRELVFQADVSALATTTQLDDAETAILTAISEIDCGGGGGGGLTGPYDLLVTVRDDNSLDPIEAARVRIWRTGETGTLLTDASGEALFALNAATWNYTVTAAGYQGATGTIGISSNDTLDIELEAIVIPPSDPPLCSVLIEILNQYGQPSSAATAIVQFVRFVEGADETPVVLSKMEQLQADMDGTINVELFRNAAYVIYARASDTDEVKRVDVTIPDAGSYVVQVGV